MSTVRKVAKNTGIVIIWNILIKFVGLFISIYLARYLGVGTYGDYSFVLAYTLFLGVIIDLGVNNVLVREIAKNKERANELITNAFGIKLALFAVVLPLSIIIINLLGYPSDVKTSVYIAMFAVFLTSNTSILTSIFQVDLKMEYPAFADLISKSFLGLCVLVISIQKGGIIKLMVATLASNLLALLLMYAFSRNKLRIAMAFDRKIWVEILSSAVVLGLSGIFASVFMRVDQILLSIMRGNIEVGYYSPPSQLTDAVTLIPLAFTTSLFPLMSSYSKNSRESLIKSFRLAVKYMLMLSIPMAFGTTFLSDSIIAALYGSAFLPSSQALAVMIWTVVFIFCSIVFDSLLVSINQQKKTFIASAVTATFNIILNLLLIPYLGFMGAAIALLISHILAVLIYFHFLPKFLRKMDTVFIIKSIVASIVMVSLIKYLSLRLYVAVVVGVITYFVALLLLGGINKEDFETFKQIW